MYFQCIQEGELFIFSQCCRVSCSIISCTILSPPCSPYVLTQVPHQILKNPSMFSTPVGNPATLRKYEKHTTLDALKIHFQRFFAFNNFSYLLFQNSKNTYFLKYLCQGVPYKLKTDMLYHMKHTFQNTVFQISIDVPLKST